MKSDRREELLLRNTAEVVTEEEVDELLEEESPTAYVGYEVSGPVHLGHWMSARKLLDIEEAGFEPTVLLADEHTLMNKKADFLPESEQRDWIEGMADYWQATFEGLGLDDTDFVRGSEFQNRNEYLLDVRRMAGNVTESRAEHALGDIGSDSAGLRLTQLEYPLLQSLDIEYLNVDLAIGGTDQRKIHMLAREELPKIGYDAPTAMHYPLLLSLKGGGRKMSSSKPGTMFSLHADEETIAERIEQAYCPKEMEQVRNDVGNMDGWDLGENDELLDHNPVLQISKYFVFGADQDLVVNRPEKYGGNLEYTGFDRLYEDVRSGELHPQDLKNGVTDYVIDRLEPVRDRFEDQPGLLEPLEEIGHEYRRGYH